MTASASQCTFWCSVLSDVPGYGFPPSPRLVSMHLLVLSAFRRSRLRFPALSSSSLNAPFGAQCFPTWTRSPDVDIISVSMHLLVLSAFRRIANRQGQAHIDSLNAPFGAQCFPTCPISISEFSYFPVSMHLLVLSAFRHNVGMMNNSRNCLNAPFGAQCFPT